MIAQLKPYAATKDSGIEWLGDVPAHWEVRRLRNVSQLRVSNVDKHTKEGEAPVRLCNYVDVYKNDHIRSGMAFMASTAKADEVDRFRLCSGDVLITKDSEAWNDIGVPALVQNVDADVVSGYHLALLRPDTKQLEGTFLFRAMQSRGVAHQFHVEAKGVTRYGLSHDAIKSVQLPVPPLPEQTAIARFLDHADHRIQRYIRAKNKLITLLDEQKQAIIHQAVTGQIDVRTGHHYPAYKPSSVAYVSTIPKQWQVRKLGSVATVFNGSTPSRSQAAYWTGGEIPWLNSGKVNDEFVVEPSDHVTRRALEECSIFLVPSGAVIVGLVGQGRTRGMAALLQISTTINQNLAAIVPTHSLEGAFLHRFLNAHYEHIREMGRGGNQEALNCDVVARFRVTVPPLSEQRAIACYLEDALSTFASALSRARKQIALCLEIRTRLIADVVTGKLDAQEVVAALPKVDPLADDDEGHDSLYAGNALAENQPVEVAG